MPARSSRAMRLAMMVCASMVISVCDEIVDERRRRHHVIGRDHAHRHDVLGVDDDGVGRHRDHRIEVARGERVGQVADVVGEERLHQREVGAQRRLQQVGACRRPRSCACPPRRRCRRRSA